LQRIPCFWAAAGVPTIPEIARDRVNPHSDAASLQVKVFGSANGAQSTCVPGAVAAGSINRSFWYRTTDVNAFSLQLSHGFFSSADCLPANVIPGSTVLTIVGPSTDGAVAPGSGTETVPAGVLSMSFSVIVNCVVCPMTGVIANFDDLSYDVVLAVRLDSFTAKRSSRGVVLRWRTDAEVDTPGFNAYRQRAGGRRVRVSKKVIRASQRRSESRLRNELRGNAADFMPVDGWRAGGDRARYDESTHRRGQPQGDGCRRLRRLRPGE